MKKGRMKEEGGEIKMSRVLGRKLRRGKVWGNKLIEEGGREVTTEEGKEGDKVKECSETTGPLFPLKELPRHSALMGGLQVPPL